MGDKSGLLLSSPGHDYVLQQHTESDKAKSINPIFHTHTKSYSVRARAQTATVKSGQGWDKN